MAARTVASPGAARLVALANLPLAAVASALLWRSRDWPLVGDATIFHFIADQMRMGAVPYRDIIDVNMPLIYVIHAAVVAAGGMSDIAWRAFDLGAAAMLAGLIVLLVAPAGRAVALHAALIVLIMHLLLGPYSAGQRDFLMSIPALAVALASAAAAENRGAPRARLSLLLAGVFSVIAASIKPTGLLLLGLPAAGTMGLRWREALSIAAGAAATGLLMLATLAAYGALDAFIGMMRGLMPAYAVLGSRPLPDILRDTLVWLAPVAGLALAAALSLRAAKPPRVRVMIGLALFGLVHLIAQRKGWFYHIYPLAIGLCCWGAWSLSALPTRRALASLAVTAAALALLVPPALTRVDTHPSLRAAAAMQQALQRRLPPGTRVQALDADNGAFLAMARTGMRQATPHLQWFSLLLGADSVRRAFIAALADDPPAAILLTNSQWPLPSGFEAADDWPEFAALLRSGYVLDHSGSDGAIAWRLYLRRTSPNAAQPDSR
ncbi:MAG TPA: hypothetical protein VH934_22730 [Xanthobacteraceae bacterium]